jgi:hypothetical protein
MDIPCIPRTLYENRVSEDPYATEQVIDIREGKLKYIIDSLMLVIILVFFNFNHSLSANTV